MVKKESNRTGTKLILIIICIIAGLYFYSRYVGTEGLEVKEYSVINNKIPESFNGFKIVHFSDVHYGMTTKTVELNDVVNKINSLKPDIIVFTGDLIDHNYKIKDKEKEEVIKALNNLNATIGIYSVRGNHDKTNNYDSIITKTNIKEINNMNTFIYYNSTTPIVLVGLDDYLESKQNFDTAFNYINPDVSYYTILLAHEPDTLNKIEKYDVDLMLSGHSHNGQVRLPFIGAVYTPVGAKSYYEEKYQIGNTSLYISSGIGTSSYKLRLLDKPSINFYRLYTK
jgi:uncharacterized protein